MGLRINCGETYMNFTNKHKNGIVIHEDLQFQSTKNEVNHRKSNLQRFPSGKHGDPIDKSQEQIIYKRLRGGCINSYNKAQYKLSVKFRK